MQERQILEVRPNTNYFNLIVINIPLSVVSTNASNFKFREETLCKLSMQSKTLLNHYGKYMSAQLGFNNQHIQWRKKFYIHKFLMIWASSMFSTLGARSALSGLINFAIPTRVSEGITNYSSQKCTCTRNIVKLHTL
ncbi:unnamed protein product (macronuclear) [Paramecium tetraurelia]|uniref:Uncharacterized protein n=1 Tax=Paramecium tetraurelia TaxID=5888 RepID=A0C1V6_PARTE|nr:uncharacterized protein GSPATT00034250001 [Paramecium tetraurelia]CAK64773.1 unnamed protein product [Paramecium tetraurelia]|eukprot:XP_001432170.1 hypothetical protein (macronuclear) [Paramecium tetraurelia strain d4-2]